MIDPDLFPRLAAEFETSPTNEAWFAESIERSKRALAHGAEEWAKEFGDDLDVELAAILAGHDAAP